MKINKATSLFFFILLIFNIYMFFTFDWSKLNIATIILFLVSYILVNMAINIGWHRYFCHKSFKCSKMMEFFFLFFGSASFFGNINTWVVEHKKHHLAKNNDPFNPHGNFLSGVFWWMFDTNIKSKRIIKEYSNNQVYIHFNKYFLLYSLLSNLLFIILFFIMGKSIISSIFLGFTLRVTLFHLAYSLSHEIGHLNKKYISILEYINLGEGNHLDHHKNEKENNFNGVTLFVFNLLKAFNLIS